MRKQVKIIEEIQSLFMPKDSNEEDKKDDEAVNG